MTRSFHIVDIENLIGGDHSDLESVAPVSAAYRSRAAIGPTDQIIVGTNMNSLYRLTVGLIWPGARLVAGHGTDGADRVLLDTLDPSWIVRRGFGRVVIGSGDHPFAPLGIALKRAGVTVHVVGRFRETHSSLWPAAHLVLPLFDALTGPSAVSMPDSITADTAAGGLEGDLGRAA